MLSIIGLYALFIVEEIIRLSESLQEPLIVREETNTYDSVTYKSLGYTLNRNYKYLFLLLLLMVVVVILII